MSPTMANVTTGPTTTTTAAADNQNSSLYQKGVKHLYENGISKVPTKYILPSTDRPNHTNETDSDKLYIDLPIIDFAELQGPNRHQVLKSLAHACEHYGFFQLVNHGIGEDVISGMIDGSKMFFELPFEERAKYMSPDMHTPVRYGTSFNQEKDNVFSWRDFLKLVCHPLPDLLPHWPSSPVDMRKFASTYAKETRSLFLMLAGAVLESLLLGVDVGENDYNNMKQEEEEDDDNDVMSKELEDGSQLMVVNCFPPCPEPDLTLGMPPHSDYGLLTLLLQDNVEGLQVNFQDQWVTVQPLPNSFVVNVGDHLEILSNGKYKSVLHRVIVSSNKSRISVATLHSLPFESTVRPWAKLINEANPKRFYDTDFAAFLAYASSREAKRKNFLESRRIEN